MYEPTSNKPLLKVLGGVGVGGFAGALVTLIVWMLHQFAHIDMDASAIAALTTVVTVICAFVAAYLIPLMPGEVKPIDLAPHPVTTPPEAGE